jgi:hypothetical protein
MLAAKIAALAHEECPFSIARNLGDEALKLRATHVGSSATDKLDRQPI